MRLPGPAAAVLLTACLTAVLLGSGPAQARRAATATATDTDTVTVPPSATVTVSGHGYGHGHGMSQWGAQGAALQGLTYRQVIEFYYPGTAWGTTGGAVSVLITADTSPGVVVRSTRGLTVKALGTRKVVRVARARPRATAWKLVPRGTATVVSYRTRGWHRLTKVAGDAEFSAHGSPLTLKAAGTEVAYRGRLRSVGGATVNVLPLESYLRGVVPREVPALWSPAAVQAQAVAARTYAAYERAGVSAGRPFQLYDTTRSQVYGGASAEQPGSDAAIAATRHEIVTYAGAPAFAQFSASNGGWVSAGTQPYLVAKQDPYDAAGGANPHTSWTATLSDARLEQQWPAVGDLTRIDVPVRDGNGDLGGRADDVVLTGTTGTVSVSGEDFRFLLGLKSDWFGFAVG